ncbi:MAG: hypothetical protein JSV89_20715 [Spirochaetaceae bacterium]|nr:MAG: hypothetical protein JSV89_20715 [Spirochaetaceae bacterium]
MKMRSAVIALCMVVALFLFIPGCDKSKNSYPKEDLMAKISGEWKNTEYDLSKSPARRIIDLKGNLRQYDKTYEDTGERTGRFTITKAWTESEGWVWFTDTIQYDDSKAKVYELCKLDLQMMDWHLLWSEKDFPGEWDAVEYPAYFYRK